MTSSSIQSARQTAAVQVPISEPGKANCETPEMQEAPEETFIKLVSTFAKQVNQAWTEQPRSDDPESAAREILKCVAGPECDFTRLEQSASQRHTLLGTVQSMPPEAWAVLQKCAQAANGGVGITSVTLGRGLAIDGSVVGGLKELSGLKTLILPSWSRDDLIDLSHLQGSNQQGRTVALESVRIVGEAHRSLTIRVPAGVSVESVSSGTAYMKSRVWYADSEGHIPDQEPRPLSGQVHYREAREFADPGKEPTLPDQFAALENLNGQTEMAEDELIVCRHLTAAWLDERLSHATHRSAGPEETKHYSYANFQSTERLKNIADPGREYQQRAMLHEGARALFEPRTFGKMLAHEFDTLPPGESRHFAIRTDNHMLGLELRAKQTLHGTERRTEYVVNLYDPNSTATHQRFVVGDRASVGRLDLTRFLGIKRVKEYFPQGGAQGIGMLHTWPPGQDTSQSRTEALNYVSGERYASSAFLHAAMICGHVTQIRESVRAMAQSLQPGELEKALLGVGRMGDTGLFAAGGEKHQQPAAVDAYVSAVLALPDSALGFDAKCRLLKPQSKDRRPWLTVALSEGHTDSTKAFLGAVLNAPETQLTRQHKLDLLVSHSPDGQSMLSLLCASRKSAPSERYGAIVTFIAAVVDSNALSLREKEEICASARSAQGPGADRGLTKGDPLATAAMLQGILSSTNLAPPEKRFLMQQLGVSVQEVTASIRKLTESSRRLQASSMLRFIQNADAQIPATSDPLIPNRILVQQTHLFEVEHARFSKILMSPMPPHSSEQQFTAAYRPFSQHPAKLALDAGNPAAAAGMLLAVLESNTTPEVQATLQAALGVTAGDVISGLANTLTATGNNVWLHQMIRRIEASAMPRSGQAETERDAA